ncbi:MAG: SpoIIE family protein phosphatase [Dehalococcoidia bacterium]|nr:SpoIIE family protein phosphatase [Dehalococcoidia bacterium]
MEVSIGDLLIDLVKTAAVIIVFAYVVTRATFFTEILDKRFTRRNQIIIVLLFGALSVFGTYGGIRLPSGAIANIRDLAPMVAGLIGGPVIGLGVGLIGGVHRYFLGGFVCLPCALATVIAGLMGGVIYKLRKGKLATVWQAALFAALMELFHMGLVLLIARPYVQAVATVKEVILPMMGANAGGVAIFAMIVHNLITERKTAAEKEKYRRELERREFEAETARGIQQSFLPESPPQIEGFDLAALSLPAWEVGGDFYDFIPISEKKWGLVIADVSGKGIPAALFMALSRTLVRANVSANSTVSEAIQRANHLISEDARSGMFVTLFYAVLDSRRRRLSYVNAGHNAPLLLKPNGGDIVLLEAKGIALGVLDDINLEEKMLDIASDDIVILYTDGVTEAINEKEEQFGQERLIETIRKNIDLPANDLIDRIKEEVTTFACGQPQFDDFTLVALKAN